MKLIINHSLARAFLCSLLLTAGLVKLSADPFVDLFMMERLERTYGKEASARGEQLNKLLARLDGQDVQQQLLGVNRHFNQFTHQFDPEVWGEADYWATPEEFIGKHTGDCEDYVIAKYFALRYLGIPDDRLFLTYVKALKQDVAHMVLTYFETPQSIPLVLDNYDLRIRTADKRPDLLPVYSFNAEALFLTNASAGLGRRLPTDKVKNSKWTSLLNALGENKK